MSKARDLATLAGSATVLATDSAVTAAVAAASGPLVVLGDRLGLFRALAANGPLSSTDLARQLALHERYVREWLNNRVAAQYVQYAAASARYFMTPEQAVCLADADSPAYLPGGYYAVTALYPDEPKAEEAFSNRKNQMLINRTARKTLSSENLTGLLTPPTSTNSSEGFRN